ncbi:hypothetical protein ACFLTP_03300 [Chloroflexota bacterium]
MATYLSLKTVWDVSVFGNRDSFTFLIASYSVTREFPGDNPFSTVIIDEPIIIGNEKVNTLFIRILNYSSRFAVAGKAVFQVEIETSFGYWFDLQAHDRKAYNQENKRVADEFLARVEKYYPGLSTKVDVIDVATPYTTWRCTLNRKGAWLMTSDIIWNVLSEGYQGLRTSIWLDSGLCVAVYRPACIPAAMPSSSFAKTRKRNLPLRAVHLDRHIMNEALIAPCGMNCAICSGFLAFKHDVKNKVIKMRITERVDFTRSNIRNISELVRGFHLKDHIVNVLNGGPTSLVEIAEFIQKGENSVRAILSKHKNVFTQIGKDKWGGLTVDTQ